MSSAGCMEDIRGTVYPFNVTLNIVGVIRPGAPVLVLVFHRDYFEEAAGQPGLVDWFWVRVDRSENVPQLIAALDEASPTHRRRRRANRKPHSSAVPCRLIITSSKWRRSSGSWWC